MSKNAFNKRKAKARHKAEFSRYPPGFDFGKLIFEVKPPSTPFMDALFKEYKETRNG